MLLANMTTRRLLAMEIIEIISYTKHMMKRIYENKTCKLRLILLFRTLQM